MILLAGETEYQIKVIDFLKRSGYYQEQIVSNLIARAMKAPSRSDLQRWCVESQGVTVDIEDLMNKSTTQYGELVARIKTIDANTGGKWFIHDFRPLWFLEKFQEVTPGVVVVAMVSEETETNEYYRSIKNLFDQRLPKGAKIFTKRPTQSEFKAMLDLKPKAIKK